MSQRKKKRRKPATVMIIWEHGDKTLAKLIENHKKLIEGDVDLILKKLGLK